MKAALTTMALAAVGATGFSVLNLPLPFLLGPLFSCLIAGLAGARMSAVRPIGAPMRTILGVAVGSAITPELVGRLPDMAMSAALIPAFILVIGLIGYPFFRKVCGFDGPTAYYCAMPGGLQDMMVFGQEAGADMRAVSLVHATRILLIVTSVPLIMHYIYQRPLDGALGQPLSEIPPTELALMVVAALGGWKLAERLGIFGASIIGPMVVAAVMSLIGLIEHRPPAIAIMAAQFFIGISVGSKYTGVTARELRIDVAAGIVFCLILAAISLAFAEAVMLMGLAPGVEAFLAFAPGGQAEMAVLALVIGADLPFVITHHLLRLIIVILGAPVMSRLFDWGK